MAISKRLRYEVLRRDDFACRYCGAKAPDVELTVDHVVPEALGGKTESANLVTACQPCNAGKSSSSPDSPIVEAVGDDALRWGRAIERAAEIQREKREAVAAFVERFDIAWSEWTLPDAEDPMPRPDDWRQSVARFYEAGLDIETLIDAVESTMARSIQARRRFRYFCGVCWNILAERQEMAREFLEAGEEGDESA